MLLSFCGVTESYAYKEHYMLSKDMTFEKLKPFVVTNQKWVDYPSYEDRAGWAKMMGEFQDDYIKAGEEYLDYEWIHIDATDYLIFERTGDRLAMQDKANSNNDALSSLFLAELAEGKGRFIDQLINGVYFYCEMTNWVMSAHVAFNSDRSLPDLRTPYIDLGAGYTGAMLAWIYYYLSPEFEKVIPTINHRLRYELQEKIMDVYIENDHFGWMAKGYGEKRQVNNWNPWCNVNSLMVFALLENDPDKLTEAVLRTMQSVDKYINYTKEDGACEEGPSYWKYAGGKLFDYLLLLNKLTDGKVSVFDHPMIKRIGEYIANSYVGDGWVINFGDADGKTDCYPEHIFSYGSYVGSDQMMSYAKLLDGVLNKNEAFINLDLFRVFESLAIKDEFDAYNKSYTPLPYVWYPQTEYCYMTNDNGFFFAGKGGHNNESHNHNDTGTFNLYMDSTPIIIDAGVGIYTRQTFSKDRYKIWTMQSKFHNLPTINGVQQGTGFNCKATGVNFNAKTMTFSLDIAESYPNSKVISWVRSSSLKANELKIVDRFEIDGATVPNQINFMCWGDIDISKSGVIEISVNGKNAELLYNSSTFDIELEKIVLNDKRLSKNWGSEIYHISLVSKKVCNKGSYSFVIRKK